MFLLLVIEPGSHYFYNISKIGDDDFFVLVLFNPFSQLKYRSHLNRSCQTNSFDSGQFFNRSLRKSFNVAKSLEYFLSYRKDRLAPDSVAENYRQQLVC